MLELARERTRREGRAERTRLRRELAQSLRQKDRERLRELREAIRVAKAEWRARRAEAVERCRAGRATLKARAKERRRQAREALRAAYKDDRERARLTCATTKATVRDQGLSDVQAARAKLEAERHYQLEMGLAERRHTERQKRHKLTAREQRAESDDEVRANIDDDLVPVFNQVRGAIKGSRRMSRTEAFYHWAEAHPDELIRLQGEHAERQVAELIAEHEKHRRVMRPARYKRPARALEAELAAAPF